MVFAPLDKRIYFSLQNDAVDRFQRLMGLNLLVEFKLHKTYNRS